MTSPQRDPQKKSKNIKWRSFLYQTLSRPTVLHRGFKALLTSQISGHNLTGLALRSVVTK